MLREIAHFCAAAPETLALRRALPQAEFFDLLMGRANAAGLGAQRRALAHGLDGRVLEVGCGTGRMFEYYGDQVSVDAIDVDEDALALARPRAARAACRVDVKVASALALPFADRTFDAVVMALVLCSVERIAAALHEVVRVARPGAEVRLIEHVRSPRVVAGALMALVDPVWVALNGQGCHMARRTELELERAGLDVVESEPFVFYARGLPAFPMRRIRTRTPA